MRAALVLLAVVACTNLEQQPDGGCLELTIVLEPVDAGVPSPTGPCELCPGATSETNACDGGTCETTCRCGAAAAWFPAHPTEMTELDCLRRRESWLTTTSCR